MTSIRNRAIAFGLAGAFALGMSASASAGPLPTGTATVKQATTDHVTDIRWRGRGHGWGPGIGIGAGIAAGALIGSAVAARPYGYYDGGYYYDEPVYAAPYAYEPVYPSSGYRYGYGSSNYCQEGYRRVPCTQGGGY